MIHRIKKRRQIYLLTIFTFTQLNLPLPVWAGSITSGFAKVKLENLQPGRTYRVSKFFQPIIVVNSTDDPSQMTMELVRPPAIDVDPDFEPIPDVTWAALEKDRFDVKPWERAESDLFLTIPMDKEFLGKKYQLHIWTKATGGGNVGVGLMHKLLFTVATEFNPEAGKEPSQVLRFKLEPFEYFAKNVKFNRTIDLYEQSGTAMVLRNPNNRKCRYRIEVIRFEAAPIVNLKEYEPTPAPEWLSTGDREIEVEGGKEKKIPLSIKLPKNPNFRNKKYLFLVRATLLDGEIPFSVISRVYITTSERLLD